MVVGLTGGIGSGKTTIAGLFSNLGVPVYIADDRAKFLMTNSKELKSQIVRLLGDEAYHQNDLNRKYIADRVFNDKSLLSELNKIVHPVVNTDFENWHKGQQSTYVIKEAAILFENGSYKNCDFIVLVTAPMDLRVKRVRKRDHSTEEEVLDRINNQWRDARKISLADAVIENIHLADLEEQVLRIHHHINIRILRDW